MSQKQQGFTTVELLVTLFVGVLFVLSGYQLYGAITLRAGNAREQSEASNIGYGILRSRGSNYTTVTNSCNAPQTENIDITTIVESTRLPDPAAVIKRCKPFENSPIVQVTVQVTYGNPRKEVVHATYLAS